MSERGETWRELSDAEVAVARPFTLRCEGLSDQARDEARTTFVQIATRATRLTVAAIGRIPTHYETDALRKAVTDYCNQVVIPTLREGGTVH